MAKALYLNHLDASEVLQVIHINSIAPLIIIKHFRQLLAKSKNPMVINISSWLCAVSNLNFGGHYAYVGSKNLLNVLNKSMALELATDNIICININPGWVKTDMGGQKATYTTQQAVNNMLNNVVFKSTMAQTGKFLNHNGNEHPW